MSGKRKNANLYTLDSVHHVILMYLKMVRTWTTQQELNHFSLKISESRKEKIDRALFRLVQNEHATQRTNDYGYDEWRITPEGIAYVFHLGQYRALQPRHLRDDDHFPDELLVH